MNVLKNYTYITLGACHSRMSDYMYAKVWSLKLFAKNFARDVNALAKVLRMSSARRNCDQKVLAQRGGPLYVCT